MNQVTITLPLPHRDLHPNGRPHWRSKARHTKTHRSLAYISACGALPIMEKPPRWKSAKVQASFFMRTTKMPDPDGCIAWLKAYIDGVGDAGIFANDRELVWMHPKRAKDAKNPRVELTITKLNTEGAAGDE